jgi:outer membrane translocation and assembly module TamA
VAIPYTGQTFLSFQGVRVQEVFGRQVHMALCALQHEVLPSIFLTGQVNAGNAFPESGLSFDRREYLWGAGISAGYLSLIGPLEATIMVGERRVVTGHVSVGFDF